MQIVRMTTQNLLWGPGSVLISWFWVWILRDGHHKQFIFSTEILEITLNLNRIGNVRALSN